MSVVMPEDMVPKVQSSPGALQPGGNLQLRVISSVVMVAVALALVSIGSVPFSLLILTVGALICLEWGHVVRGEPADAAVLVHGMAVAIAVLLATVGHPVLGLCAVAAGAAVMIAMTVGRRARLSAAGVVYVGCAAVALIWLRGDSPLGFAAVLFLFLIVWTTDTMAFVAGRAIGGVKLWPSISPNKTWAGLLGGVGFGGLVAAMFAFAIDGSSAARLALIGVGLGIVAQAGDLAESALKRRFGVKDASDLIPGHGGVMDRMDGIIAVAIVAALLAVSWDAAAPARALLLGSR